MGRKNKKKHNDEDDEMPVMQLAPRETGVTPYFEADEEEGDPAIFTLVAPDMTQCQCEWADPHHETFGPRARVRCEQSPTVVAFQRRRMDDNQPTGTMSLCDDHRIMIEHMFPKQCYYRVITSDKKIGEVV